MRFARSFLCVLLVLALSVGFAVAEETEDNYGIIEAFAKAETLSASAYIDDDTFEVELSEEAVDVIRNMADTLVSQGAIDHYNPTFSQPSNLKQMNALIVYTTAPSAEQTAHLHPDSDEVAPVVEPDIDLALIHI